MKSKEAMRNFIETYEINYSTDRLIYIFECLICFQWCNYFTFNTLSQSQSFYWQELLWYRIIYRHHVTKLNCCMFKNVAFVCWVRSLFKQRIRFNHSGLVICNDGNICCRSLGSDILTKTGTEISESLTLRISLFDTFKEDFTSYTYLWWRPKGPRYPLVP